MRILLTAVTALLLASAASADDTSPPSTPGQPQLVTRTLTSVTLAWSASTDDVGVVGYKIFRNGVEVGDTDHPGVTDFPLRPNTSYTYYTQAFDQTENRSAPRRP